MTLVTLIHKREFEQGASDAPTSWAWRLTYPDGRRVEVYFSPRATRERVLATYPEASAAEPIEPAVTLPEAPITTDEEVAIRRWLKSIEETDEAVIGEVMAHSAGETRMLGRTSSRGRRRPHARTTIGGIVGAAGTSGAAGTPRPAFARFTRPRSWTSRRGGASGTTHARKTRTSGLGGSGGMGWEENHEAKF